MNDTFFNQFSNIQEYDYHEAVASDIRERINDMTSDDLDEAGQYDGNPVGFLSDMVRDYVTGKSDGSYWCNTWKAECCLYGNRAMLQEYAEWEGFNDIFMDDPEVQDVKIREYVFNDCVKSAFDELNNTPISELTDSELYLLIVLNDEWDAEYMGEVARRVDMADEWKKADSEDFEEVADEIIEKLKEQA